MNKIIRLALRIVAVPFFSAIALIAALTGWVLYTVNFIRFGGEAITYTKKMQRTSIADVFNKVDELLNKEQEDAVCDATKITNEQKPD